MINHQDLGYKLSTMINFYAVKMDLYELFVSKVRRSHKIVPLLFLIFVLSHPFVFGVLQPEDKKDL